MKSLCPGRVRTEQNRGSRSKLATVVPSENAWSKEMTYQVCKLYMPCRDPKKQARLKFWGETDKPSTIFEIYQSNQDLHNAIETETGTLLLRRYVDLHKEINI